MLKSKPRFHFESFRTKFHDYAEAVQRGWQCPPSVTDPYRRLDCLLRSTAKELQSWAATKIGNIKEQLLMAKEVVLQLDQVQDRRDLSQEEEDMRRQLKGLCLGLASLEHTITRQRSRITYLPEGDTNTRFFHLHASCRKRRNYIKALEVDSARITSHDDMAAVLRRYYTDMLGRDLHRETTINFEALGIAPQDLASLELPFTEEEI